MTTKAPSLSWPWLKVKNKEPRPGARGPREVPSPLGDEFPICGGERLLGLGLRLREGHEGGQEPEPRLAQVHAEGGQKRPNGHKCLTWGFQI